MRGVEVKIKALKDFQLNTYYRSHMMIKDEVKIVRFKNKFVVEELLKFKHFIIATPNEKEVRNIPVLLPEVNEDSLVAVENEHILPPMELVVNDDDIEEDGIDHENEVRNSKDNSATE